VTSVLPLAALGFFLGMRHATDADHVIAVSTIVSRNRNPLSAALLGAFWGIGHTFTILLVGGGIILFGWVIPPRLGLSLEFAVGLMLILLGVMNLRSVLQLIGERQPSLDHPHPAVHTHAHSHGDYIHRHPHGHAPERHPHDPERTPVNWLDRHFGRFRGYQALRPLLIGIVHGLAGSAAIALLVLTTMSDPRWGMVYLAVFGLGTVLGMMLITMVVALPFAYTHRHSARINLGLRLASGALSLGFGLLLAWEIGVVRGLFGGAPSWTPH
jgi:cytochrome c biogenesis protein CcdA